MDAEGDIAGAAADIEEALAGPRVQPVDHRPFPQAMDAARHQVVHQVIAAGDRGKPAHQFGLLRRRRRGGIRTRLSFCPSFMRRTIAADMEGAVQFASGVCRTPTPTLPHRWGGDFAC